MICSSFFLSALFAVANAQNSESTTSESQSTTTQTAAHRWDSCNSELSKTIVSIPAYGSAYGDQTAYPTAVPTNDDLPEIYCHISCSVEEATSTSGETESVYKRSLENESSNPNNTSNDELDPESDDSETGVDGSLPRIVQDGLDAPVLPDAPFEGCGGPRVRPIAPQTPWGWPSSWKSHGRKPYMCYYHAATLPECKNIHDQAVASYCVKSSRPRLCKARACQVYDQCKSIIASGRGYCWNPKWFAV
jgi:hypothetical protein